MLALTLPRPGRSGGGRELRQRGRRTRVALHPRLVGRARFCGAIAVASAYLVVVASCAHRPPRVRRAAEDSESVELPACPTAGPPVPAEGLRGGRYGEGVVGYTLGGGGPAGG